MASSGAARLAHFFGVRTPRGEGLSGVFFARTALTAGTRAIPFGRPHAPPGVETCVDDGEHQLDAETRSMPDVIFGDTVAETNHESIATAG
jgi:hypothetical protein